MLFIRFHEVLSKHISILWSRNCENIHKCNKRFSIALWNLKRGVEFMHGVKSEQWYYYSVIVGWYYYCVIGVILLPERVVPSPTHSSEIFRYLLCYVTPKTIVCSIIHIPCREIRALYYSRGVLNIYKHTSARRLNLLNDLTLRYIFAIHVAIQSFISVYNSQPS